MSLLNKIAAVLVLAPALVSAAPVITGSSGAFDDGGAYTIGGTGFGTKAQAAPQIWDRYEEGTNHLFLADVDTDYVRYNGDSPSYYSANPYTGNMAVGCTYPRKPLEGYNTAFKLYQPTGKVFACYKSYQGGIIFTEPDTTDFQHKNIRLKDTRAGGAYGGAGYFFSGWWTANEHANQRLHAECVPGQGASEFTGDRFRTPINEWYTMAVYFSVSDQNVANGAFNTHMFCTGEPTKFENQQRITWATGTAYYEPNSVLLPTMMYNITYTPSMDNVVIYCDDLYVDNTPARVFIGNASTYTACTNIEMQIPTSWSTTSVTFTVNTGQFATDDLAWIYICDSSNSMSAGFPVVIGASGGGIEPVALTAPTNLQVNGGN